MTSDKAAEPDFTTIALEFLAQREQRAGETLPAFIARYPQYARELTMLAFETAAIEGLEVPVEAPPPAMQARLRADARAALFPHAPPLTSLLARARDYRGLSPRALAARLGVGVDVLALLEERHIRPDTVVAPFLARLAETLGSPVEVVRSYLERPPLTTAQGIAYHAPQGHRAARRLSFAEAIAESHLTTPNQKDYWLAYATPDDSNQTDR